MAHAFHDSTSHCAVTAISTSPHTLLENEKPVVYSGSGSNLSCYNLVSGDELYSHRVLFGASVHGIVHSPNNADNIALVFGERSAKLINLATAEVAVDFGVLDDWIWDAKILQSESDRNTTVYQIAFGLALGFVELWTVDISQPESVPIRKWRVRCGAHCIMYAMNFWPLSNDEIWIASGTVFNKVLVWKAEPSNEASTRNTSNSNLGDEDVVPVAQTLLGHNGAVFKVKWSKDGRRLCSVSDDRTVKLWGECDGNDSSSPSKLELKWSSYGHRSRVWDCAFWIGGVVSVGEDCTAQIWDNHGTWLTSVQVCSGRNCWSCDVDYPSSTLITGGADGSLKLWDIETLVSLNRVSSGETVTSNTTQKATVSGKSSGTRGKQVLVPSPGTHGSSVQVHNQDLDTVTNIVMNDNNNVFVQTVTSLFDSFIWMLDLNDSDDFTSWSVVLSTRWKKVSESLANISRGRRPMSVLASLTSKTAQGLILTANRAGSLLVCRALGLPLDVDDELVTNEQVLCVIPDWYSTPIVLLKPVERLGVAVDGSHTFVSASVDGELRLCQLLEQDGNIQLSILGRFRMSKPTTPLSVCLHTTNHSDNVLLVCGDARGSVHVWEHEDEAKGTKLHRYGVLAKAHGRDKVTAVHSRNGVLYSSGHNGMIVEIEVLQSQYPNQFHVIGTRLRATTPVVSVEQLSWKSVKKPESVPLVSTIVSGFHAGEYLVYDSTAQYVLAKVACGGWNRPYAASTFHSLNDTFTLVYAPPRGNNKKCETVQSDCKQAVIQVVQRVPTTEKVSECVLRGANHGRVIWDVIWFPTSYANGKNVFVTGSEDGLIKMFLSTQTSDSKLLLTEQNEPWSNPGMFQKDGTKVSTSIIPLTIIHGHLSAVRCLSVVELDSNSFLLVSGGGQDQICCWRVTFSDAMDVQDSTVKVELLCEHVGAMSRDDVQRVLSVGIVKLNAESHCIVASDSSGKIAIYDLKITSKAKLTELGFQTASHNTMKQPFSASTEHATKLDADEQITKKRVVETSSRLETGNLQAETNKSIICSAATSNPLTSKISDATELHVEDPMHQLQQQPKPSGKTVKNKNPKKSSGDKGKHVFRPSAQGALRQTMLLQDIGNKPVLCMKHLEIGNNVLVWTGSTDGFVRVWNVHMSSQRHDLVLEYAAHKMGVNCIAVTFHEQNGIRVVTGGDDQAITVAWITSLKLTQEQWRSGDLVGSAVRIQNGDASALRSVFSNGTTAMSVGLNQRLRTWLIGNLPEVTPKAAGVCVIEGQVDSITGIVQRFPVRLVHSVAVDVSDTSAMHALSLLNGKEEVVVVAGAGVQVLRRIINPDA